MPAFVLLAPKPLSGKTTIAAALAQRLKAGGKTVVLSRLGDDANAAADKALFAAISSSPDGAQVTLTEAATGESGTGTDRAIVVADGTVAPEDIAAFCAPLAGKLAGVVLNRVPARRADAIRAEAEAAGLKVIGMAPEDRLLASPTLGEVAEALQAEKLFFNSSGQRLLDRTLIASIAADPGQGYFAGANTVIVRSDKPDLQLAALNAGANAMIVTGELPILSYVLNRAEEDTVPLLRTKLKTADAVKVIEDLYASRPFAGGAEKLSRAAELAGEIDLAALLS